MNELAVAGITSGSTVIAQIRRDTDEYPWRVDTLVFEVYSQTNFDAGKYDILCTEQGSSGYFTGDFPTDITDAGIYNISFYTILSSVYTFEAASTLDWDGSGVTSDNTVGINWITLNEYKDAKGIIGSKVDNQITALIPYASSILNSYIGRTIKSTTHIKILNGSRGLSALNVEEYPVNSIGSVTFEYTGDDANTIDGSEFIANEVGTLRFRSNSAVARSFSSRFIKAVFTAGYSSVPTDLKMACIITLTNMLFEIDDEKVVTAKSVADVTIKYDKIGSYDMIPTSAQLILDRYRDEDLVVI